MEESLAPILRASVSQGVIEPRHTAEVDIAFYPPVDDLVNEQHSRRVISYTQYFVFESVEHHSLTQISVHAELVPSDYQEPAGKV